MKFILKTIQLHTIIFLSLNHFNCSNIESEKSYCEKKAKEYFLLCMINVSAAPGYFGKSEWNSPTVQAYSQQFCLADFQRKSKCADQKTYRPHRKD